MFLLKWFIAGGVMLWSLPVLAIDIAPLAGVYYGTPLQGSVALGATLGQSQSSTFEGGFAEFEYGVTGNRVHLGYLGNAAGLLSQRLNLAFMTIREDTLNLEQGEQFLGAEGGWFAFLVHVRGGIYVKTSQGASKVIASLRVGGGFF